jgi:hypothetical protein
MAKNGQHVEWGPCCLCGRDIEAKSPDPLRVTAETSDGKWQVWFAHASCFKDKLIDPPDAPPGFFDPAHF